MLRAIGVRDIRQASNGREAPAALEDGRALPTDVILCDLEMPEMDGFEFLRAVAKRNLARGVIVRELDILDSLGAMVRAPGLALLGKFAAVAPTGAPQRMPD